MTRLFKKEPLLGAALMSAIVAILKFVAFIHSGSLIVLWSLLDSLADGVISFINHRVEKLSAEEADRQHPFGHGGFEVVSGLIQGTIIAASAGFVAINGVERMFGSSSPTHNILTAMVVMLVSAVVGLGIGWYLSLGDDASMARETDKAHYMADFYVNLLSAGGLLCLYLTGIEAIDALFAIFAGIFAVKQVFPIFQVSYDSIVQKELDVEIQKRVIQIIYNTDEEVHGVHRLRSRRHGSVPYVDFHLALPDGMSLEAAHAISDRVEEALKAEFPDMDILIHIDPESHVDDLNWSPSY